MQRNTLVIVIIVMLLIGFLSGYLFSNSVSHKRLLEIGKNNNISTSPVTGIELTTIKNTITREKYSKALLQKNNPLLEKVSNEFKLGQISEQFLEFSLDYINGTTDFLPETKQLFKNLDSYNELISNGSITGDDGFHLDTTIAIKYLLPFSNIEALRSFGANGSIINSYNNFVFLKNPINDPLYLEGRIENRTILELKDTGIIPDSLKDENVYLYFLFTDLSRKDLFDKVKSYFSNLKKLELLKTHSLMLGFGFDVFTKDITSILNRKDYLDYLTNNRVDYFYIDKSLFTGKDLCYNIINPDIQALCKLYVQGVHSNEKYTQIIKEYLIHTTIY